MKLIYKFNTVLLTGLLASLFACQEPETATPVPATTSSGLSANFLFINTSADAPSLDLYVNNVKSGTSQAFLTGQQGYSIATIATNGVGANTNIRAKATSGSIGGVLGSNDVIFRAASNNSNNFAASNGARYTFIAVDTIYRPMPLRKLNKSNFADTTFYNTADGQQLSTIERAALSSADKAKLVAIGTVPLASTDPGGVRFLLLTDTYPTFTTPNTTKAGIRFIHASPNSPALWARLKPATGGALSIATNVAYMMSFPAFSPSVGSRSTTASFTLYDIAASGTPIVYTLEISTTANFTNIVASIPNQSFEVGKIYTVCAAGLLGKTDSRKLSASVTQHN